MIRDAVGRHQHMVYGPRVVRSCRRFLHGVLGMRAGIDEATSRRKSAGGATDYPEPGILPFDLIKRPIRPLNAPLASQQLELTALASAENELIANKLEAMEERNDPDRAWAKVNKYNAYAARGFGTFAPDAGRGGYME